MLKRAISYYRSLNIARREHSLAGRPSSNQLHHMMSERKRREKINESFQALRALLPPGTKVCSILTQPLLYVVFYTIGFILTKNGNKSSKIHLSYIYLYIKFLNNSTLICYSCFLYINASYI